MKSSENIDQQLTFESVEANSNLLEKEPTPNAVNYTKNIESTLENILSVVNCCIHKEYLKYSTLTIEKSKAKDAKDIYYIYIHTKSTVWRLDESEKTLAKIKFGKISYIAFNANFKSKFDTLDVKYTKIASEGLLRVSLDDFFNLDKIILTNILNSIFISLFNIQAFGCCGKFKKCEQIGYCIHDDMIYSTACQYRKIISKGPHKASEIDIEELKQLKRESKLPVKKQLIYYKQIAYLEYKVFEVVDFEIEKELPSSRILKIYLDNGETVLIMCDFLAEMQKPNFTQIVSSQME